MWPDNFKDNVIELFAALYSCDHNWGTAVNGFWITLNTNQQHQLTVEEAILWVDKWVGGGGWGAGLSPYTIIFLGMQLRISVSMCSKLSKQGGVLSTARRPQGLTMTFIWEHAAWPILLLRLLLVVSFFALFIHSLIIIKTIIVCACCIAIIIQSILSYI